MSVYMSEAFITVEIISLFIAKVLDDTAEINNTLNLINKDIFSIVCNIFS